MILVGGLVKHCHKHTHIYNTKGTLHIEWKKQGKEKNPLRWMWGVFKAQEEHIGKGRMSIFYSKRMYASEEGPKHKEYNGTEVRPGTRRRGGIADGCLMIVVGVVVGGRGSTCCRGNGVNVGAAASMGRRGRRIAGRRRHDGYGELERRAVAGESADVILGAGALQRHPCVAIDPVVDGFLAVASLVVCLAHLGDVLRALAVRK